MAKIQDFVLKAVGTCNYHCYPKTGMANPQSAWLLLAARKCFDNTLRSPIRMKDSMWKFGNIRTCS